MQIMTLFASVMFIALNPEIALSAGYTLDAPTSGAFSQMGKFLKDFVAFMTGPFAITVSIIAMVVGGALWQFAPNESGMKIFAKIAVVMVVILNVGTWIAALTT